MISKQPPTWAKWFSDLGASVAAVPLAETGERAKRIVVSVPTGQFTTWLTVAGALIAEPPALSTPVAGIQYATWNHARGRMDDCEFVEDRNSNILEIVGHPGAKVQADMLPARQIPAGTPTNRSGIAPRAGLRDELRQIPGLKYNLWHWYARRCLSPVVVIGDGREYLRNQREELIEKAPDWLTQEARILLSEDSQQVSNPTRMYFHPFMVFSASVGNDSPWLREMKPRLVIVTSWSSYTRKHQSLFAGSPHIILTNRRVVSALKAADFLEIDGSDDASLSEVQTPPHGIFMKTFDHQVLLDQGEMSSEDELEIEI